VPTGAEDGHWVRCPICGAEYRIVDLQQHEPPVLELIDEPAVPAEGRVPQWGAVAAATAETASGLAATEFATPAGDLPEIEMLVAPPVGIAEPVISADVTDDSEVVTFDDSLLLDEPTDVLSEDDTLEPYEFDDVPEGAARSESGADEQQAVTAFEPVEAASQGRTGEFGLPPRRRSRRGSPIVMGLGVVGGGVLGLAIGYAILLWGFSKDPFALGPKLPDVLVPAALRSTSDSRVVQYAPANPDASAQEGQSDLDDEPLFPPPNQPATSEPSNEMPTENAATESSSNDITPDGATLPKSAEPTKDDDATDTALPESSTRANTDSAKSNATRVPSGDPLPNPFGDLEITQPTIDPTAAGRAAGRYETFRIAPTANRSFSVEDLMAAVDAARPTTEAAVTLPANAELAKRIEVNREYYSNLAKVAEAFAHLDRSADSTEQDKAMDAAIGALLDAVPTSPQLAELGKLGGYWYANPKGDGIVLAGIVKDSKASGALVTSVVQPLGKPLKGDPPLITVISPAPLTADPSRPVLVAGTIVNRPTENLRGYEGSAARVVWSAMALDPTSPRGQ
jgi:hypothetical protein